MSKKEYIIDFTNVNEYLEIHLAIKAGLDFPDYYGCNWSAFWDLLTEMYGEELHIKILGLEVIKRKFDDTADKIISILKRFKHYEKTFENDICIEIMCGKNSIIIM